MITKELFIKYMQRYQLEYAQNEAWLDKVDEVFPSMTDTIYKHDYNHLFLDFICDLMADGEKWIDYFIYEKQGQWFDIFIDENNGETGEVYRVVHIDSYEKLWRLITGTLEEDS